MKIVFLLVCIAFAGCGGKTNEDIARELVEAKLKTSLAGNNMKYEPVNFGKLGTAFLAYEETEGNIANSRSLNNYKDSITNLEKLISETKTSSLTINTYRLRLKQVLDSTKAISERNNTGKRGYTPEKLFKISHAYKLKDKSGITKQTEEEFYIDKDLTKVVKVHKVY
ncbi:MAG: hypothetical protein WKI04_14930 [Ferruginibacter sp.]